MYKNNVYVYAYCSSHSKGPQQDHLRSSFVPYTVLTRNPIYIYVYMHIHNIHII